MTSRFSNAMVIGDLEKNNVGKMLTERMGQEKLGVHDYKQSFQNILLWKRNRDSCPQAKWFKEKVLHSLSFFKDGRKK